MAELPYVCLYTRYLQTLAPFSDDERGRLMSAMLNYAKFGEIPEFAGNERYIWPTIQAQIDRDAEAYREKCEKNRANGAKGGRPKNQTVTQETERFSDKPKKANINTNKKTKTKSKRNVTEVAGDLMTSNNYYGEYKNVVLSDIEMEKLVELFPVDLQDRIERLSEYIASTGKKYKSHYATIRSWANKDKGHQPVRPADRGGYPGAMVGPNGIPIDPTKNDLDDIF